MDGNTTYADGDVQTRTTDNAGNVSDPVSLGAVTTDTTALSAPTVTISEDANDDGSITGDELSGDVDVTISIPNGAVVGDIISVTDGTTTTNITITDTMINDGDTTTTFTAPANGETLNISATVTDAAGNVSSSGTDSAVMNLSVDAPIITAIVDDASDDDAATITVSGTAVADSSIEIFDNNDNSLGTVTTDGDGNWSMNVTALDTEQYIRAIASVNGTDSDPSDRSGVAIGGDGYNNLSYNKTDNIDYATGGGGMDYLRGSKGADVLDGGAGTSDQVSYKYSDEAVNVNLETGAVSGGDAQGDTISNFEKVKGSAHDDTLVGFTTESSQVQAGAGDDIISNFSRTYAGDGDDIIDNRGIDNSTWNTLKGDAGNDTIYAGDISTRSYGGTGDDTIHMGTANSQEATGGAGDDTIYGGGGNNDRVIFSGDRSDYEVTINDDGTYTVKDMRDGSPDGTDTIVDVEKFQFANGTINVADLTEDGLASAPTLTMSIGAETEGSALTLDTTTNGDDEYFHYNTTDDSVITGDGKDTVHIEGTYDGGNISTEAGDDVVVVDDTSSRLYTGDGNDNVIVNGDLTNWVDLGAGDDNLVVHGAVSTQIRAHDGVDSVELKHYSKADYDNNVDSIQDNLKDVENIKFNDGNIIGDEAAFDADIFQTTFSYEITLNGGLTDADGSESLSSITVDNLPAGASITGTGVTDNGDGTYTVEVDANGDATVTLESPSSVSTTDLNGITSSITSTESDGGDTSTTEVHATTNDIAGTDGDDTITGTAEGDNIDAGAGNDTIDGGAGADNINAGAGDDTIAFDGTDTIDGGTGNDTITFDGNLDMDFDTLAANQLTNIEAINLDSGDHTLTNIDINDVVNMTDDDNTLTIFGDSGDEVELQDTDDGAWTQAEGTTTVDGHEFVTFSSGDATVLIENDIHVM